MSAKRLLVSLDEDIFNEINYLAKLNKKSSSSIAQKLIVNSLELEEDKIFAELADERVSNTKKWISHDEAWK